MGLALVLTGCGGATKTAAAKPTATVAPAAAKAKTAKTAVAKAVKAYSAALVAGKGKKAFPMLSARCRKVIGASGVNAIAAQAHQTYPHAKIKKITVTDVKGAKAHVSYTYSAAILNQKKQPWVKEKGAWRWNGC
ncbi:hypothetical protein acdb102_32750 [Acidothermaceae bacterium B102]|nr:hypothetical protein acdb102_32750 [Acidothermaceae bacterium B102]